VSHYPVILNCHHSAVACNGLGRAQVILITIM
jgi:hypothetical protein